MPAQQGGSRDSGPFPPSAYREPALARYQKARRELEREQDLYMLWHECYETALAHLQPQLRAAWIEAERRYLELAKERGLL